MEHQIISCKQAKSEGLKHYFTGKPCKHGHIALRFVTGGCQVCQSDSTRSQYKKHTEKKKQATKDYRELNRERINQIQRSYYSRNAEKLRAEQTLIRARRLQRVPAWAELDIIAHFYELCPPGMQVDHVIPLQGEFVSGLHVLDNLQYLTESANKAKRNRIDLEEIN